MKSRTKLRVHLVASDGKWVPYCLPWQECQNRGTWTMTFLPQADHREQSHFSKSKYPIAPGSRENCRPMIWFQKSSVPGHGYSATSFRMVVHGWRMISEDRLKVGHTSEVGSPINLS